MFRSVSITAIVALLFTALCGCSSAPRTVASLGIARSQGGVIIAIVRVCEGEARGIQLFGESDPALVFGAAQSRITTWTSPDPITAVGATNLVGDTYWPADPLLPELDPQAVYTMSVFSSGLTAAAPLRFTAEAFAGIGVEQVLTADPESGTAQYLSIVEFFNAACDGVA